MSKKLGSIFDHGKNFYGNVILNPSTLAAMCSSAESWNELLSFHHLLVTDEYVQYLDAYYRESLKRFGNNWRYFDVVNVLFGASKTVQPKNYLEIGVRRGRSACTVARGCPSVNIIGFDLWDPNYAGMENPGPAFVKAELLRHGHTGTLDFIDGDSHQTIPMFFSRNPQAQFDMILVDGDHSEAGALDDLKNVIPHLAPGGVLVFDDIAHPQHRYLLNVWRKALELFPNLTGFEFGELGFGAAFAINRGS